MSDEPLKKSTGEIFMSWGVRCPHCEEMFYSDVDREEWLKMFGGESWSEVEYGADDVECAKCHQHFDIDKFVY